MLQRLSAGLLRSNSKQVALTSKRCYQGILYQFSPPKNKVNNVELVVFGILLASGIMGPSLYVASNMQEYNGKAAARRAEGSA